MYNNCGVLKVPLNVFRLLLAQVAQIAVELNDDKLNLLMVRLGLYELSAKEVVVAIDRLEYEIESIKYN